MTRYKRSAYGDNPRPGRDDNGAQSRGWGPGWPNCQGSKMGTARGGGVAVQVRREVVPLVAALLEATKQMGYDLLPAQTGGFSCRAIRGSRSPSNHSWGLAVDINWNHNPMGLPFRSEIPPAVVRMWEAAGWFWGGRYRVRPDTMHFSYIGTPDAVERHLRTLGVVVPPVASVPSMPEQHVLGARVLSRGDSGEDVAVLQRFLGITSGGGKFGPVTEAAVRRYQKMQKFTVDGVCRKQTWKPILAALKGGTK